MANSERITLKLSAIRALLGAVFPQLRAVYVFAANSEWRIRFYVDGVISEGDRESLSIAATEIIADLPTGFSWTDEAVERLDCPLEMVPPADWEPVFARKESNSPAI